MNKNLSKRLMSIINLIDKNSVILDVGTDHGYVPIYVIQNKIAFKAYASDISEHSVNKTKDLVKKLNLEKYITVFLSDGLNNINIKYDTLIIAGMGYYTINHILKTSTNLPNTIIIQSNSDLYKLRKFMNKLGYKIFKEEAIYDKNKFYSTIKYVKGKEYLKFKYKLFGKSFNKKYYKYLKKQYLKIVTDMPLSKKVKYIFYIFILKSLEKQG